MSCRVIALREDKILFAKYTYKYIYIRTNARKCEMRDEFDPIESIFFFFSIEE